MGTIGRSGRRAGKDIHHTARWLDRHDAGEVQHSTAHGRTDYDRDPRRRWLGKELKIRSSYTWQPILLLIISKKRGASFAATSAWAKARWLSFEMKIFSSLLIPSRTRSRSWLSIWPATCAPDLPTFFPAMTRNPTAFVIRSSN